MVFVANTCPITASGRRYWLCQGVPVAPSPRQLRLVHPNLTWLLSALEFEMCLLNRGYHQTAAQYGESSYREHSATADVRRIGGDWKSPGAAPSHARLSEFSRDKTGLVTGVDSCACRSPSPFPASPSAPDNTRRARSSGNCSRYAETPVMCGASAAQAAQKLPGCSAWATHHCRTGSPSFACSHFFVHFYDRKNACTLDAIQQSAI